MTDDRRTAALQRGRLLEAPAMLCCGIAIGAGLAVGVANAWPRIPLAPTFHSRTTLTFGVAADGRPALCGSDGAAYVPMEGGYLAFMSRHEPPEPGSTAARIVALSCEPIGPAWTGTAP